MVADLGFANQETMAKNAAAAIVAKKELERLLLVLPMVASQADVIRAAIRLLDIAWNKLDRIPRSNKLDERSPREIWVETWGKPVSWPDGT